jgi:integrin beta 3
MYEAMREFIRATVQLEVRRAADELSIRQLPVTERADPGIIGPAGERGEKGADGRDGVDGKNGADGVGIQAVGIEAGELLLTLSDGSTLKAGNVVGPRGEKGDAGPEGSVGPVGPVGPMGSAGKDGVDGSPGLRGEKGEPGEPGESGERGKTGAKGESGEDGRDGRDGSDGKDGKDGIASRDEIRAEIEKTTAELVPVAVGAQVAEELSKRPEMEYRGVWSNENEYRRGNWVTWGGSLWHCDEGGTVEKPGSSDDWTLAVKKGRDGRDAK